MKPFHSFLLPLVAFLALLGFTGCQREPLYDLTNNLLVVVDIDGNVVNMTTTPDPETMYVGLYDPTTHALVTSGYIPGVKGTIEADPSTYDVITFNFDTEYTQLRNTSNLLLAEAYACGVSQSINRSFRSLCSMLSTRSYEEEDIVYPPDYLFAGTKDGIMVPKRDDGSIFTISLEASSLVETWLLVIGTVSGMDYVASAEAFVTGQVEGMLISERQPTSGPATLYVELKSNPAKTQFLSTFNTFGRYPSEDGEVYVVLKVVDTDGNEYSYQWDVTAQMTDPLNTAQIITVDQELSFEGQEVGGGLETSADRWEQTEIDIAI